MMKLRLILYIFIIIFISSSTSNHLAKEDEDTLKYNEFLSRNNSNVTYLLLNEESEIQACEYVKKMYGRYENGRLVEEEEVTHNHMQIKHYFKCGTRPDVFEYKFFNEFDCLNFLVHDKAKRDLKVPLKKYLRSNNDTIENIIEVKSTFEDIEGLCNTGSKPAYLPTKDKSYNVSYESEMEFPEKSLVDFGKDVSIGFSNDDLMSFSSEGYVKKSKKHGFKSSWTVTRPSQDVLVPGRRGMLLSRRVLKERILREYTVDLEVDDGLPKESSKRFKIFREKLRSGEVTLNQRKSGVYFDFSSDKTIVLRNFPVHEYVTRVSRMYVLSDPAPCNQLNRMKKLLTLDKKNNSL